MLLEDPGLALWHFALYFSLSHRRPKGPAVSGGTSGLPV